MGKSLTLAEAKSKIQSYGFELLSKEYINSKTKLKVSCEQGHEFEQTLNILRLKKGCPKCNWNFYAERRRFTTEEVRQKCLKNKLKLLSDYKNSKTKILVRCDRGHERWVRLTSINNKSKCFECNREDKIHSYDYVTKIIEQKGYILLSKEYKGNKEKLDIKCPKNHIYSTSFASFYNGCRCITCYREKQRKNLAFAYEEVKNKIESKGYKLLSSGYKNAQIKLNILCPNGHVWKCNYANFSEGYRCGICHGKGFDPEQPGYLYYCKLKYKEKYYYKVGVTNKTPLDRLKAINKNALLIWQEAFLWGEYAWQKEKEILRKYKRYLLKDSDMPVKSGWSEFFTKDVLNKDR